MKETFDGAALRGEQEAQDRLRDLRRDPLVAEVIAAAEGLLSACGPGEWGRAEHRARAAIATFKSPGATAGTP